MTVTVDRVSFSYTDRHRAPVPALRGLSLGVRSGECVGILGPEGSGKSTLLQVLGGLLRPLAGVVEVDGVDLWTTPGAPARLHRRMGFAFQFPEQQFLCGTVEEELVYTADRFGVTDRLSPGAALGRFGLSLASLRGRSPLLLSMGEARRLALASLLVHRPSLVLLDEPASGLDGAGTDLVIAAVRTLRAEGAAVVMTSHDVDLLAETADRVVLMAAGKVVCAGSAPEILLDESVLGRYGFPLPDAVETLGLSGANIDFSRVLDLLNRRRQAREGA